MVISKISSRWTGNPQLNPTEYITIADILAVNNNQSGNKYNSIVLTLGNAYTGETYTQNAQLFNGAGAYTLPLSLGTIANGSFTPSNSASFTGANALNNPPVQCLAWVRNDQWMVFATRDVKTQPSNIAVGEIYLYAPASNAFIHLKNDNTIQIDGNNASVIINSNGTITVTGSTVSVTNGGTLDFAAMSSKVDNILASVKATLQGGIAVSGASGSFTVPYTNATATTAGSVLKSDK